MNDNESCLPCRIGCEEKILRMITENGLQVSSDEWRELEITFSKMQWNQIKPTWGLGRSPLEPISRGPGRNINLEEAMRLGWRRRRSASVSNRRARRAIPEASSTKEGDVKFPRKRKVGEGETVEYPSKRVSRRVITYEWERNSLIIH